MTCIAHEWHDLEKYHTPGRAKWRAQDSDISEKSTQVIDKLTGKYNRPCKGITIDVYDVLKTFNVTNPATAHAVKKLLASGQRGYKDVEQDLREAIESIERAMELKEQK